MTTNHTDEIVPCRECLGYGYLGHTNPAYGDECPECKGRGEVTLSDS